MLKVLYNLISILVTFVATNVSPTSALGYICSSIFMGAIPLNM